MVGITLDDYIIQQVEQVPGEGSESCRKRLTHYVELKLKGEPCFVCGATIWAIGSSACDTPMCFTCITGEANDSDDYEIIEVCWR